MHLAVLFAPIGLGDKKKTFWTSRKTLLVFPKRKMAWLVHHICLVLLVPVSQFSVTKLVPYCRVAGILLLRDSKCCAWSSWRWGRSEAVGLDWGALLKGIICHCLLLQAISTSDQGLQIHLPQHDWVQYHPTHQKIIYWTGKGSVSWKSGHKITPLILVWAVRIWKKSRQKKSNVWRELCFTSVSQKSGTVSQNNSSSPFTAHPNKQDGLCEYLEVKQSRAGRTMRV